MDLLRSRKRGKKLAGGPGVHPLQVNDEEEVFRFKGLEQEAVICMCVCLHHFGSKKNTPSNSCSAYFVLQAVNYEKEKDRITVEKILFSTNNMKRTKIFLI